MTTITRGFDLVEPGFDIEADIVPAHIAAARTERRLMMAAAVLAALVLGITVANGVMASSPTPDLTTYAFRV